MLAKFFLLASCVWLMPAAPAPQKIFPYSYSQQDLSNGLRLVVVPAGHSEIVAVYIVVRAGSRNEVEPGHTGFAHLFEHLMFKGTPKFPREHYDQTLRRIGAASNAFTSRDFTCYYTIFSRDDLPAVIEMEADRFQNLRYSEAEFKTEALAVLGEYNAGSSNPFSRLRETLQDTAFDRSPYKHTTVGFLRDIQDMPNQYAYSQSFFDRYYRPEYTTILVVGDVKARAVRSLVDRYWSKWKRGSYSLDIPTDEPQRGPRAAHVDWPAPTLPIVTVAYKGPAYTDTSRETAALDALAELAFSANAALYRKLVIEQQKVEVLSAAAPEQVDPSLFEVTARVRKPEDLAAVRDDILQTIKHFREHPVDSDRLDAVRKNLRYGAALQMTSSDSIAAILAPYVARKGTPESMNRLYDQYAALTPADIQQAAAKFLVDNNRTIVILTGPDGGSR